MNKTHCYTYDTNEYSMTPIIKTSNPDSIICTVPHVTNARNSTVKQWTPWDLLKSSM